MPIPPEKQPSWHRDPMTAITVELENLKEDVDRVTRRIEQDARATVDALREAESLRRDLTSVENRLDEIRKEYVSNKTFNPVKSVVYGLVAAILLAVISGLMALLFTNHRGQ